LLAADEPLTLDRLLAVFPEAEQPDRDALQGLFGEIGGPDKSELRAALQALAEDYRGRGIEVVEVASGWRIQVGQACSPWVSRLWDERPARYSRALMETLALIAYRQPITRGEIEDIRGVAVSSNIIKTLMEREWIRVVGQRDVPGRPSLYGTTREFLDYFGLRTLDQLPTLAELRDLEEINRELDLEGDSGNAEAGQETEPAAEAGSADETREAGEAESDTPAVEVDEDPVPPTGERQRSAGQDEA
jgi:segregation and condensation protein B